MAENESTDAARPVNPDPILGLFFTRAQLCECLRISDETLKALVDAGLRPWRIGGRFLFLQESVAEFARHAAAARDSDKEDVQRE